MTLSASMPSPVFARRALDCRDLVGLAWRQRWLMGTVVALCVGSALLACAIVPASYRSTALVVYEPSPLTPDTAGTAIEGVDGEVEFLKSEAMLGAVADQLIARGLAQADDWLTELRALAADLPAILARAVGMGELVPDPEPQTADERRQAVIDALAREVTISRRGMTDVVAIEARAARPESAARLANLTAVLYVEQQFRRKTTLAEEARAVLAGRAQSAERRWKAESAALLAPPSAASEPGAQPGEDAAQRGPEPGTAARWRTASPALRVAVLADRAQSALAVLQSAAAQQAAFDQRLAFLAPDARIVSTASADPVPAFPQRPLVLAGSLLLGLCLAGSLGHRRDGGQAVFASPQSLEQALGAPVLASLPRLDGAARRQAAHEVLEEPGSPYSAALRRLSLMVGEQACTVLVTSATAREGKSLTAIALARTVALSGRRTLLVDCDLIRPGLAALLDVPLGVGLADHLAGPRRDLGAFARRDRGSGADLLLGLPREDLASDRLLASPCFAELLLHARRLYDVVILDGPSLSASIDPLVLARHADRCLMVIGRCHPEPAVIEDALSTLNRIQAIPVGLVLNGLAAAHSKA